MTGLRNVNRCTPCLEGEHRRCTGSAGNVGCGCIHAAPVPQHVIPDAERLGQALNATPEERQRLVALAREVVAPDHDGDLWRVDAAAQAIADAEERGRERGVRPFRDLFAGGPDTPCRTVWDESEAVPALGIGPTECVSVPIDDLRAAFDEAGEPS